MVCLFAKWPVKIYFVVFSPPGSGAGQLGGIIDTEQFIASFAEFAPIFDASFCDPTSPTLISILNQLRQASDIMKDGSQDPAKVCDGISIGIGFTMKPAKLGPVALPEAPGNPGVYQRRSRATQRDSVTVWRQAAM